MKTKATLSPSSEHKQIGVVPIPLYRGPAAVASVLGVADPSSTMAYRDAALAMAREIRVSQRRVHLYTLLGEAAGAASAALISSRVARFARVRFVGPLIQNVTRAKVANAAVFGTIGFNLGAELIATIKPATRYLDGVVNALQRCSGADGTHVIGIKAPVLLLIAGELIVRADNDSATTSYLRRFASAIIMAAAAGGWDANSYAMCEVPGPMAELIYESYDRWSETQLAEESLSSASVFLTALAGGAADFALLRNPSNKVLVAVSSKSVALARALAAGGDSSTTEQLVQVASWAATNPEEARVCLGLGWRALLWLVHGVARFVALVGLRSPLYLEADEADSIPLAEVGSD